MYFFCKRRITGKNQYTDISHVLWLLTHYFIVKPDQAFPPRQWDYSNRDTWKDFVQSNRLLKRMKESQGFSSLFANGPIKFKIWLCNRWKFLRDLTDLTARETTLKILNFIGLLVKKKKSEFVDRVVTL